MTPKVQLRRRAESFEIRYADGTPSLYFYFDDDASRRAVSGRDTSEVALEKAKAFARSERERLGG
jgi:hypothetical protein